MVFGSFRLQDLFVLVKRTVYVTHCFCLLVVDIASFI